MRSFIGVVGMALVSLVAITGPAFADAPCFTGEVRAFAQTFTPWGWVPADGATVAIKQQPVLFSIYGTSFGGDGVTTFKLPKRAPRVSADSGKATLAYAVCVNGQMATGDQVARSKGDAPASAEYDDGCLLGEIRESATPASDEYVPADGRSLPIASNTALFAVIGARFGGDGIKTFALPKLAPSTKTSHVDVCVSGDFPARN